MSAPPTIITGHATTNSKPCIEKATRHARWTSLHHCEVYRRIPVWQSRSEMPSASKRNRIPDRAPRTWVATQAAHSGGRTCDQHQRAHFTH